MENQNNQNIQNTNSPFLVNYLYINFLILRLRENTDDNNTRNSIFEPYNLPRIDSSENIFNFLAHGSPPSIPLPIISSSSDSNIEEERPRNIEDSPPSSTRKK